MIRTATISTPHIGGSMRYYNTIGIICLAVMFLIPNCSKKEVEVSIHSFFQRQLIKWYFLKVGNRCRSIWTVGVSTWDGPKGRIIHRLDPRIKIDEVPDGSANGPHSNSSYHPLKGHHLVRTDPFPGILVPSDCQDSQSDQNR